MQFASKEDIEAPLSEVFAMLCEFETFERSAIRRGIEVQRVNPTAPAGVGLAWDTKFKLRGRQREMRLTLTEYEPPNTMQFVAVSQGIDATLTLDLLALSHGRTRMAVVLNIAPKNLSARLLIQSLKLAKGNLNKRYKVRVAEYAKTLEERHNRMV